MADLLPPDLLTCEKRSFGIPLDRWFREDLVGLLRGALGAAASRLGEHVSDDAAQR